MKKLVAFVAIIALSAPLYAADVTIEAVDLGGSVLGLYLTTGPSDPNVPIGISFRVALSGGATIDGSAVAATSATGAISATYNIHLDAAYQITVVEAGTYAEGDGHPLADVDGPGYSADNAAVFSYSSGRLDAGPHTGFSGQLVAIQLVGSTTSVTLSNDALRGGVIGQESAVVLSVEFIDTVVVLGPTYPACWDAPTQCHGDSDGSTLVNGSDFPPFRDGFLQSFPATGYIDNACGDFNRDGIINGSDFPAFRDNFLQSPPADCPTGDINGVF